MTHDDGRQPIAIGHRSNFLFFMYEILNYALSIDFFVKLLNQFSYIYLFQKINLKNLGRASSIAF